jgi:L-ribulose-5-phosphate 4-epimerase
MPEVNAVIHTHQVYASAVGLVEDVLPAAVTILPNACLGPVMVAPFSSAASLEMGITVVKYINNKRAVILKNHGVITVGGTLKGSIICCCLPGGCCQDLYYGKSYRHSLNT